jgi:hypothetical protein
MIKLDYFLKEDVLSNVHIVVDVIIMISPFNVSVISSAFTPNNLT